MTSGLLYSVNPFKGKVLIIKDKVADKTAAGIALGINDKGRCVSGTVLSGPRKGKRIIFRPGISSAFDLENEKVTVIFDYDIRAEI